MSNTDCAKGGGDGRSSLKLVRPFRCRMWAGHYRLPELINEKSCAREIESFLKDGQKQPALGRRVTDQADVDVELIYGARRLYVAQHLGVDLLVDVRDISDRDALVAMEIENSHRKDISPYERGIAYASWLRNGVFSSQKDLAKAVGVSEAQVSRLLRFGELPAVVMAAFCNQTEVKEAWAVALAERCKDLSARKKIVAMARLLERDPTLREPTKTFALLLHAPLADRRAKAERREVVVRSTDGRPLFRISYRSTGIYIVLSRERTKKGIMDELTDLLRQFLDDDLSVESSMLRTLKEKASSSDLRLHAVSVGDAKSGTHGWPRDSRLSMPPPQHVTPRVTGVVPMGRAE